MFVEQRRETIVPGAREGWKNRGKKISRGTPKNRSAGKRGKRTPMRTKRRPKIFPAGKERGDN